jgi:tRNA U34 5-methylaminomethyl-2-thiouridine-forming methyltransferase MnmC
MADVSWVAQRTDDGSFTFFSDEFGEAFHSRDGAREEAVLKFAQATDLEAKATRDRIRLLDICYGLGYNTAAALESIWAVNPVCQIEVVGLELDETVPRAAIAPPLISIWSSAVQESLTAIGLNHHYTSAHLQARLLIGDARQTIQSLAESRFQADAIFFDPFSPRRCPQLWTIEFFACVAQCLAIDGKLATYSRSAAVRSAMQAAGFHIGTMPLRSGHLPHEWSQGTIASFDAAVLHPLSQMEREHLQTRAAVPYRDPNLSDRAETILKRHNQEQNHCQRESTSSWRRRWGIDS